VGWLIGCAEAIEFVVREEFKSCWGEGAVYRAVASLQRAFFDPPTDCRAHWDIEREFSQASKLKAAPAIEYGGDLRHVRYRRHAR
jgi:hypothetical protein